MSLRFTIPLKPLGVNALWRNIAIKGQPRTLLSREGRAYLRAVSDVARIARGRRPTIDEPVCVRLSFWFETWAPDIDGPVKAILDGLAKAGIYTNDNRVRELHVFKAKDPAKPRTEIEVERLSDQVELESLGRPLGRAE